MSVTSLRSLIAAFLADLTCAQHRANRLSEELSRQYRWDSVLRYFPVPNALLEEADVTLRFVLASPETDADPHPCAPVPARGLRAPSRILSSDLAQEVSSLLLVRMGARLGAYSERPDAANDALISEMRRQLLSSRVRNGLTQNLAPSLHAVLLLQTLHRDTQALEDQVRAALLESLQNAFQDDAGLRAIAGLPPDFLPSLLDEETLANAVQRALAMLDVCDEIARSVTDLPSLQVRLAPADLTSFPDYAVQSLRVRARLRNYKWVIVKGSEDSQLLPEH